VIFTEQVHPTINTPSLKQFAIAKLTREQLLAYPVGTEHQERIHVVTARVEELHANSKYVTLSGEHGFGYDKLLLATGSAPMGLPPNIPGRNFDGVMTLHRLQDYLDLRRRLSEVQKAVVIGGGVHAIETVMGLLHWGIRTHWLIRGKKFLPKMRRSVLPHFYEQTMTKLVRLSPAPQPSASAPRYAVFLLSWPTLDAPTRHFLRQVA
jgi:NAD(P)H-nitrite reductase large subunit